MLVAVLLLVYSEGDVLLLLFSARAVLGMIGFCKRQFVELDFWTTSEGNYVKFLDETSIWCVLTTDSSDDVCVSSEDLFWFDEDSPLSV